MAARATTKKPSDHTGQQTQRLAREHADELAQRANEISMATEVAEAEKAKVVDLTDDAPVEYEEEEPTEVVGSSPQVIETDGGAESGVLIRVNETLTQVSIGAGKFLDFEEGRSYRVPRHVADHLEEKGYVWH